MDLAAPELRLLMDLRYKPHFMAHYQHLTPETQAQQQAAPAGSFDGIPVPAGQLLAGTAARRELTPDVTVEVQALHQGLSGRA